MRKFLSVTLLVGLILAPGPAKNLNAAPDSPAPADLAPAEVDRIVVGHNRWVAGLRTVRAGGKARVGAEGEKTRAFNFSMVLSRPGSARLQGRWGSLATLFDLNGDADGWTLYLPREQTVVRAGENAESAGLLMPPLEIISVLLPAGIPPRDLTNRGAITREETGVRLVVPPGSGGAGSRFHRVIWVDPEDGKPLRVEIRRQSQLEAPILVARYEDYEGKGREAFPGTVSVEMEREGQWARFEFETVRINSELTLRHFEIRIPEGTRVVSPDSLTTDFLPVEDER